jgi:HD-GYP domain-containing protein (c-di-GMP phosphodiesterase class II)
MEPRSTAFASAPCAPVRRLARGAASGGFRSSWRRDGPCRQNAAVSSRLRLADLLAALSVTASLGFGLPPEHAMRACLIGTALARRMGLGEEEVGDVFYATLLLHVGCTGLAHETVATWGDDVALLGVVARTNTADPAEMAANVVPAIPLPRAAAERLLITRGDAFGRAFDTGSCEVASETARRLGLGAGVQRALYEIVEWWAGGWSPQGIGGDEIARAARVARVAGDAATFAASGSPVDVVDVLRRRAGTTLDPGVVDAFAQDAAGLIAAVGVGDPRERILEVEPEPVQERSASALPDVAAAFGDVADLKVPYAHGHSRAVARLAVDAGRRVRLDARTLAGLEVAAHLHDVGRAAITNRIWEKPGRLTSAEWEQVRMHAYHSERILATSGTLAPLAPLAGMHHERLDGSGYHRACRARELPAAARVLAAADAFQAMTQPRPHRPRLGPDEAGEALSREARAGRLDRDAVGAVLEAASGRRRRRPGADLRPAGLSEREVEVVRLVAAGCSNPEVAERLVISRRTAEHHVQHIYAKLGVSSRAAVALFALEHELVQ